MDSSSSYNCPCAACKFLRRKCMPGCIFAPSFPPEKPQKFANMHKIFGASNVIKLLNELLPHQREDAVNSLAYEAEARSEIQSTAVWRYHVPPKTSRAPSKGTRFACNEIPTGLPATQGVNSLHSMAAAPRQRPVRIGNENGGGFHQTPSNFHYPYPFPWNDHKPSGNIHEGGVDGNI